MHPLPDTPRFHRAKDTLQHPEAGLMHQHTLAVEALEVYTKQGGGFDAEARVSPVTDLGGGGRGESPPTHNPYMVTRWLQSATEDHSVSSETLQKRLRES